MSNHTLKDIRWLKACDSMGRIMAKCSKAQYFCFVIDRNGRICGGGYNGTPSGMPNCIGGGCPRAVNNAPQSSDYNSGEGLCWAVHAEVNALMGVDRETLKGATLYVNGEPCVGCAKQIAGSGVMKVVCYQENRSGTPIVRQLFDTLGIEYVIVPGLGIPSPHGPPCHTSGLGE